MFKSNISMLSKAVLIATLGLGTVACSSPEQDAEARGDVETPTTPQDSVVENVTENNEATTMEATESESIDPADEVAPVEGETREVEAAESKSVEVESSETLTEGDAVEANDDVIDGSETEENVSTY